jgi:integrase
MPSLPTTKPLRDKLTATGGRQIDFTDSGSRRVPGLALRVSPSGRKSWTITARRPGNKNPSRYNIGDYREMDLTDARDRAIKFKGDLREGLDPVLERRLKRDDAVTSAENTYGEWVTRYLDEYSETNHTQKTHDEVRRVFNVNFQEWNELPLASITPGAINSALQKINRRKGNRSQIAGNRYFAYLRAFFSWAKPLCPGLDQHPMIDLKKPKKKETPRDRALTIDEVATLWMALPASGEFQGIVRALILTGARRSEVAGMEWREIDLKTLTWRLPASRAKEGKKKEIPLSPALLAIIKAQPKQQGSQFVFSTINGKEFKNWTLHRNKLSAADELAEVEHFTLHDIRRSVSTLMNGELNAWLAQQKSGVFVRSEVVEEILGHAAGGHKSGVAATYNGATYDDERRLALDAWANFLNEKITTEAPDNVVPLVKAKATTYSRL